MSVSPDSRVQWEVTVLAVLLVEQSIRHLQLATAPVIDAAALFHKVHLQKQARSTLDFWFWP